MHKKIYSLIALFTVLSFIPFKGTSQVLPPYQLTVLDTTITGYYFFATKKMSTNQAGYTPIQVVLDERGKVVYYRKERGGDFTMQPNGLITYYARQKFMILDSTFTVIDSVQCGNGYRTDAHEFQILPNGHYLLLGIQDTVMDMSSYNFFTVKNKYGSPTCNVDAVVVQELDQNKNVVFEWRGLDHLPIETVNQFWLHDSTYLDWSHSNALELDFDGNILLSSRHFCEITKINRTTGAVMWRLGGKYNQFTFVNEPYAFRGQHDIRRLPNGNITLFDNGWYSTPHEGRALEYQLDETNKIATLVWSYAYDSTMASKATGNFQTIFPGNLRLVNVGHREYGNHSFSVVDSMKNLISELAFFDSSVIYRAFFYRNMPWTFKRPTITCDIQGSDVYLKTTQTYATYLWSTGDTTSSIHITAPGTYHVLVNYGEGMIQSKDFIVTDLNNPCYPLPTADFAASTTTVCKNVNVHFTDLSDNNPTSWQWTFTGGTPSTSTAQNPNVKYSTPGTYSVTLVTTNASGTGSISKTNYITVNGLPAANISTPGALNFCTSGSSVLLNANTGFGITYQWQKAGNNISGANSSSYSATSTGSYRVIETNNNGCTKISNSLYVTGPPSPTVTVTGSLNLCPGDSVKLEAALGSGYSYQWKQNNVNIPGATSNVLYAKTAGAYKVRVTNSFGCSRVSGNKNVSIISCLSKNGMSENSGQINIYPNPSSGLFNIALEYGSDLQVIIYDVSGKEIENHLVSNTDNFVFGENLESGFYHCKVIYQNKEESFKIVKVPSGNR